MAEANRAHNIYELLSGKISTLNGKKNVSTIETSFVPAPIKFYSVKFIPRVEGSFFVSANEYSRNSDIYKSNRTDIQYNLEADNFFFNEVIKGYSAASLLTLGITLPNIATESSDIDISNDFGKFVFGGKGALIPSDNTLTINFMHLEYPIHEKFIFPWIRETQSNVWMRKTTPFYKFDIQIDFFSNNNDGEILYSYKFTNAFPTGYNLPELGDNTDLTRPVTFKFNNVLLLANPKIYEKTRTNNITIESKGSSKKINVDDISKQPFERKGYADDLDVDYVAGPDNQFQQIRKPYPPIPSFPGNETNETSLGSKILGYIMKNVHLKRATVEGIINKSSALKKINSITGGGLTTLGENPGKIIGAVMSGDMSTLKDFARGPIQSALFALNRKLKGLGARHKKHLPKPKLPHVKIPNTSPIAQTFNITGGFSPILQKIDISNLNSNSVEDRKIPTITITGNNVNEQHLFDISIQDSENVKTLEDRVSMIPVAMTGTPQLPTIPTISIRPQTADNQTLIATNNISKQISRILRR